MIEGSLIADVIASLGSMDFAWETPTMFFIKETLNNAARSGGGLQPRAWRFSPPSATDTGGLQRD